jgi:hypothetical protein
MVNFESHGDHREFQIGKRSRVGRREPPASPRATHSRALVHNDRAR